MATTHEGQLFLMTDKEVTKDCPCTFPTCPNWVRVNKFYAPAKAKCPEHGGQAYSRQPIGTTEDIEEKELFEFEPIAMPVIGSTSIDVVPNDKLRHLLCPVCEEEEPLEILAITETGYIDFGCQGCQTTTSISFNYRVFQIRSVPERLAALVKEFNIKQVGTMDASLAMKIGRWGVSASH